VFEPYNITDATVAVDPCNNQGTCAISTDSPGSRLRRRIAGAAAATASTAAAAADTAPSPGCTRRSRCPKTALHVGERT